VAPTGYLRRVQIERVKPHTEKLILDLRLDDLKTGSRSLNNPPVEDGDLIKIFAHRHANLQCGVSRRFRATSWGI
jgi:hypothetical protein